MYIHHHVREDAIQLFGFTTREEQALFRRLLEVSGIGPKVALGVLAGGRPGSGRGSDPAGEYYVLDEAAGNRKKTAQRMVLDLKDKLGAIDGRLAVASHDRAWISPAAGG